MTIERWTIPDTDEGRYEWLQRRKPNINGSEIGSLFNVSPYGTVLALYADKAGLAPREAPDNDVMLRGRIMEPSVAEAVRIEHPEWKLQKANEYVWSPEWRLGCTPDFLVHCPHRGFGVVQAKTTSKRVFEEDWSNGPPQWIVLQTLLEMMLEDVTWGAIAVLICEFPYKVSWRVYTFDRHAMAEARMIKSAAQFWDDVENLRQPAFNFAEDGEVIKAMFPHANDKVLDLSRDNRMPDLLTQHEYLGKVCKRAEARRDAVKAEIAAKLGEAGGAIVPGWHKVTYKTQTKAASTVKASTFRVLRTTRAKQLENAE